MGKKFEFTVENAEKQIRIWQNIKSIIERSDITDKDDFNTIIYKLYLKNLSVSKVAKILSEMGFRMDSPKGGRKVTSNDVSYVIRKCDISDKELQSLIRTVFCNNKKFIDFTYN